jgi:Tfp pilus assembly protein PilF
MDIDSAIATACALLQKEDADNALRICDLYEKQTPPEHTQGMARWALVRSWAEAQRGHVTQAFAQAEASLRLDPLNPHAHLHHASLLKQTGQKDAALLALRRCLALAPSLGQANFDLAVC